MAQVNRLQQAQGSAERCANTCWYGRSKSTNLGVGMLEICLGAGGLLAMIVLQPRIEAALGGRAKALSLTIPLDILAAALVLDGVVRMTLASKTARGSLQNQERPSPGARDVSPPVPAREGTERALDNPSEDSTSATEDEAPDTPALSEAMSGLAETVNRGNRALDVTRAILRMVVMVRQLGDACPDDLKGEFADLKREFLENPGAGGDQSLAHTAARLEQALELEQKLAGLIGDD